MTAIPTDFGFGGRNIAPNGASGTPDLATTLRDIADDLGGNIAKPAWSSSLTVTAHTVTLAGAGWVPVVHATTGTTPGPKSIVSSGTPSTGQVRVTYDGNGVPTLLFATGDAITACVVMQIPYTALKTTKE